MVLVIREMGSLDRIYRELCAVVASVLGFMTLCVILIAFYFRNRNQSPEVRIYRDRIEEYLDGKPVRSIRWNSILPQPSRTFDVWVHYLHIFNSGYGILLTRRFFRFNAIREKGTQFDIDANFLPLGVFAPNFANTHQLRRTFLLSIIKARPDLRLETHIYELCGVHPATLGYYFRPKVFIGTMVLLIFSAAAGIFFAGQYFLSVLAPTQLLVFVFCTIFVIVGCAILCTLMILIAKCMPFFLLNAEAPAVRRRRLLHLQ
jgi:hypothetical protein